MRKPVEYNMRADSIFPREDVARVEDQVLMEGCDETSEISMAEEPPEAIQARLQRSQDQISLVMMILSHKNYRTDGEKLRQIRVVVE